MCADRRGSLGLACGLLLSCSLAHAQAPSCADDPAAIAPIAPSSNPKYLAYKGSTIALVGISHEYLCHVLQPARDGAYCTLASYPAVFSDLQAKKNNVIRLWTVFHHSPGRELFEGAPPFANEQPFKHADGKWDLNVQDNPDVNRTNLDVAYFDNLESVVREAFCKGIVVEVTLLDPWDGDWTKGPFHPANTAGGTGFSERRLFMSYEDLAAKKDVSAQNLAARNAQRVAVVNVVRRLKKYPNVLFEVANEPDFIPSGAGVTPAQVADLQKTVVGWIQASDNPPPRNHLIMVNGHQSGAFAWDVPGTAVASAHYAHIGDDRYGAIEQMRAGSLAAARASHAMAFNENKALGIAGAEFPVDADDVRSEAWEHAFHGGAIFDAFSVNRSDPQAVAATAQLGILRQLLSGDGADSLKSLHETQPASCNRSTDWCKGLPDWGADDRTCAADGKLYWATLKSDSQYALYLHHGALEHRPGAASSLLRYDARVCGADPAGYQNPAFQMQVFQSGCWRVSWIDPKSGAVLRTSTFTATTGQWYAEAPPPYKHDIVLLASKVPGALCSE